MQHLPPMASFSDKPACVAAKSGNILTYRELDELANQGAHFLRALGLEPRIQAHKSSSRLVEWPH